MNGDIKSYLEEEEKRAQWHIEHGDLFTAAIALYGAAIIADAHCFEDKAKELFARALVGYELSEPILCDKYREVPRVLVEYRWLSCYEAIKCAQKIGLTEKAEELVKKLGELE